MSVTKALEHSAFRCHRKLNLKVRRCSYHRVDRLISPHVRSGSTHQILSTNLSQRTPRATMMPGRQSFLQGTSVHHISDLHSTCLSSSGILVPGGFGTRGTEGMMLAIKWAREQKVPFLGICLGFQLAVVEWARHVCGLPGTSRFSSRLLCFRPLAYRGDVDRVRREQQAAHHHLHARNLAHAYGRHDAPGPSPDGLRA